MFSGTQRYDQAPWLTYHQQPYTMPSAAVSSSTDTCKHKLATGSRQQQQEGTATQSTIPCTSPADMASSCTKQRRQIVYSCTAAKRRMHAHTLTGSVEQLHIHQGSCRSWELWWLIAHAGPSQSFHYATFGPVSWISTAVSLTSFGKNASWSA